MWSGFCFDDFSGGGHIGGRMGVNTFRKSNPIKSSMFVVTYDDARTAYLWVDAVKTVDDWTVASVARAPARARHAS
jgi:hypothetical protein